PRRGRPRKFARPSRAVTLTLPDDVIEALTAVDADLSRAIVRVAAKQVAALPHSSAELAVFGRRAVIVVNPSRTLERRTGVVLVPLADGRALISFDEPKTIAELELEIQDLLEDRSLSAADRRTFEAISNILRDARRSDRVVLRRRNIIVLETAAAPRARASAASTRSKTSRRISS
ncbi:MAG: hypothetical protein ABI818_16650, partial [Acidobacteriota bacterium]